MTYSVLFLTLAALAGPVHSSEDLNLRAVRVFHRQDMARADSLARAAWDHYDGTSGSRAGIAAANLAAVSAMKGLIQDAHDWLDRAEKLFRMAGNDRLARRSRVSRAIVQFIDSRQYGNAEPEDAFVSLTQARAGVSAYAELIDEVEAEIKLWSNQGERVQSGYMQTRSLIAGSESTGDSLKVARLTARLARLEGSTGGHRAAESGFERAARILASSDRMVESNLAKRNVGLAQWKQGKLAASKQTFQSLLFSARKREDHRTTALVLNDLSMLLTSSGDFDEARIFDQEAQIAIKAVADSVTDQGSVVADLANLYKMRFVGKPTYLADLFDGFYSCLAISPEEVP